MRLIDADILFHDGVDKYGNKVQFDDVWETSLFQLRKYIERQPTIDPVKHGHWIDLNINDGNDKYAHECSLCGHEDHFSRTCLNRVHYCWFCGAKMDEEVSE